MSFLLRALIALGGAASETSAMSIVIEEFPERLGMAYVSLFLNMQNADRNKGNLRSLLFVRFLFEPMTSTIPVQCSVN